MNSYDRTNVQWSAIAPRIPQRQQRRGCPRTDDRRTVTGMLDVLKTDCAWADLSKEYGSGSTNRRRVHEWSCPEP